MAREATDPDLQGRNAIGVSSWVGMPLDRSPSWAGMIVPWIVHVALFIALDAMCRYFNGGAAAAPWYLPPGVTVAMVMLFGPRMLPAVLTASFLSSSWIWNMPQDWVLGQAAIALCVGGGYWVAGLILSRHRGSAWRSPGFRQMVWRMFGATNASLVVSVCASTLLTALTSGDWSNHPERMLTWWIGDMVGLLIVAPLILAFGQQLRSLRAARRIGSISAARRDRRPLLRDLEHAALLLMVAGCGWLAFFSPLADNGVAAYLCYPPIIFVAIRSSLLQVTVSNAVIAMMAMLASFLGDGADLPQLTIQLFLISLVLTSLLLSAAMGDHQSLERELSESELVLRGIIDRAPLAVIRLDADDRVTMWNPAAEKIFGWSAHEVLCRANPIATAEQAADFERMHDPRIEGVGGTGIEVQRRRKDGSLVDVCIWTAPQRDADGRIVASLGIIADITEKRKAEATLRDSERRWRTVVENSPDFIILLDLDFRITFINRVVSGLEMNKVIGQLAIDYTMPDDQALTLASWRRALETGETQSYETSAMGDNGTIAWYESRVSPLWSESKVAGLIILATDITKRRQNEDELRQRAELERLLFRELDHRVRNNLAALVSLIDLEQQRATSVPGFARAINEQVHVMAAVHAMLSQSHWNPIHLNALVDGVVPGRYRQRVQVEGGDMLVGPRQMTAAGMIIHELVMNAIKHGAFKNDVGMATLACRALPSRQGYYSLSWKESGGPPILRAPSLHAGTQLIQGLVKSELRGSAELRFPADGASHEFTVQLDGSHTLDPTLRPQPIRRESL